MRKQIDKYDIKVVTQMIVSNVFINTFVVKFDTKCGESHRVMRVIRTPHAVYDEAVLEGERRRVRIQSEFKDGWMTVEEMIGDEYGEWREIPLE